MHMKIKQCSYRETRGQSGECGERPAVSAMTERAIAMSALKEMMMNNNH